MGFFSRSRSKGHYPHQSHGSGYYKRPHHPGGIMRKILDLLKGSRSHSHSYSNHYYGHYPNKHHRKSSWS